MNKIKNKFVLIIVLMICLVSIFTGTSNAAIKYATFKINDRKIETDRDLADAAYYDPKSFIDSKEIINNIGNALKLYDGSEATDTIARPTGTCLWHTEATARGEVCSHIVNVVDIKGQTATIYSKGGKTKTVTNKYVAAMAYAALQRNGSNVNKNGFVTDLYNNRWEWIMEYYLFEASKLKSKLDPSYNVNSYAAKGLINQMSDSYSEKAEEAGEKAGSTKVPTKSTTTPIITESSGTQYIGPFKMNKGGYTPTDFELTLDGTTTKSIKTFYTKKSNGKFKKHTSMSDLTNSTEFYLKCTKTIDPKNYSWSAQLNFKWSGGYIARFVLMRNYRGNGQNKAVYAVMDAAKYSDSDKKHLNWNDDGKDEPPPPSDDFSLRIVKASEDTLQPIEGAKFDLYRLRPYTVTYNKQKIEVYTGNITVKWTGKRPANTREDDYSWLSNAGINSDKREDFLKMKKIVLDENQYKKLKNYVEVISVTEEKEYTGTYFSDKTGNVKRKEVTTILDDETINKIKFREYGEPIKYQNAIGLLNDSNIAEYPDDEFYINNVDNEDVIKQFLDGEKVTLTTNTDGLATYTIDGTVIGRLLVRESDTANGSGTVEDQKTIHNGLAKVYKMVEKTSNIVQFCPNKEFGSITIKKVDTTGKNEGNYDSEDEMLKDSPSLEGVKFKVYYYDENEVKHYLADDFSTPRHTASTSIKDYLETHGEEILADDESDWYICQLGTIDEITKTINNNGDSRDNFTTDESLAREFVTDKDGIINIPYLPAGREYRAVESGFDKEELYDWFILTDEEYDFDLRDTKNAQTKYVETQRYIGNEQALTAISGRVWEDDRTGKLAQPNNLLDEPENRVSGIPVKLVYKGTEDIVTDYYGNECVTTTNDQGEYVFKKVKIDYLSSYAVMFEYNGLKYTNVLMNKDEENGSKAEELINPSYEETGISISRDNAREKFNDQYQTIEKDTSKNGDTITNNLSYDFDNHKSTLVENLGYTSDSKGHVNAQGNSTGIAIKADTIRIDLYNYFKVPEGKKYREVRNMNLGIYEREQPTLSVMKDIENVQVSINGYNHRYDYAKRFENMTEESSGFNVGVKFEQEYGKMRYTRAIYKADYEWTTEDKTNELEVKITYKIAIKNQSTALKARVNSIVDYFDKNYIFDFGLNSDLNILNGDNINYNNEYSKLIIDTSNTTIDPQQEKDVYVTLKLSREKVAEILKDKEAGDLANEDKLLKNVAEINSYSIFDKNGNVYAGIDKESNPGSAIPENENTYENDTDTAPALQLEVAGARTASGIVFLDNSELINGERLGSGAYENGETVIPGVRVELRKTNGEIAKYYDKDWKDAITETGEDGTYSFKGFIPDEYKVVYIWGDHELEDGTKINVRDYKGTVYSYNRYSENQTNKSWYKGQGENDPDKQYTDAIDNYDMRIAIDEETIYVGQRDTETYYGKQKANNTMESETFTMLIPVEYSDMDMYGTSNGDRFEYGIKNVDFGIVERPNQAIEMNKRVSSIKLTLANGEVISDAIIDESGKITGERKHLTYQGPNNVGNGFVKAELDNELIQGSTIEVGYKISVTNKSEKDYATQNYYTFGDRGKDNIIKITPSGIIDYLDSDWDFIEEKNPDWQAITLEELQAGNIVKVDEEVYNISKPNSQTDIAGRIILFTDTLKSKPIEPGNTESVNLNVSKLLTLSDEISLDNETEITDLTKMSTVPGPSRPPITVHTGREIITIPGNHIPGTTPKEQDSSIAETVEVTPSTGENRDYILPIGVGLLAFITLGAGVVLIKKFAIDK